ncbi:MAG: type III-A CRISPR-associated protein Csm2 [Clostridiales bacterium]|nr:type III-A CRISPR-associated protein Csm2 [Clostridiales bacterium]
MSSMKDAFSRAGFKDDKTESTAVTQNKAKELEIEESYTQRAEAVILDLRKQLDRRYQNFTTSKIRNILTLVSEIYNDVVSDHNKTLSKEVQERIEYLKVRLIYESGREPDTVDPFVKKSGLIRIIDGIGNSKERFIKFARYMEALVAYHRYHGGKEY